MYALIKHSQNLDKKMLHIVLLFIVYYCPSFPYNNSIAKIFWIVLSLQLR